MARATIDEIFSAYEDTYSNNRVHRQASVPFNGTPGHYYFVNRRASDRQLAQITAQSGNPEVVLTRVNDAFIIFVGNRHFATATLTIPQRGGGIEEFHWIAHTHPLEQENDEQMVAQGATAQDYEVLRQVNRRWGQRESTVIACRGGNVVRTTTFQLEGL